MDRSMNIVEFSKLTRLGEIKGDDEEDTSLLKGMLSEARKYITSHDWCPKICEEYFGFGIGGIVAVFLFRFSEKIKETDDLLWILVGDLPSAYLVIDDIPNAMTALEVYCDLMEDWSNAILKGAPLENAFPVKVDPTEKHAKMLLKRVSLLRTDIIPQCE